MLGTAQLIAQGIVGGLAGVAMSEKGSAAINEYARDLDFTRGHPLVRQQEAAPAVRELPSMEHVMATLGVGTDGSAARRA